MQYRRLGRSGIHVSPYALGTMNFGVMANADHDEAIRIIHRETRSTNRRSRDWSSARRLRAVPRRDPSRRPRRCPRWCAS
jgi:aryl-alcohol dehydrogenase-like predicted oxidoreductase